MLIRLALGSLAVFALLFAPIGYTSAAVLFSAMCLHSEISQLHDTLRSSLQKSRKAAAAE